MKACNDEQYWEDNGVEHKPMINCMDETGREVPPMLPADYLPTYDCPADDPSAAPADPSAAPADPSAAPGDPGSR